MSLRETGWPAILIGCTGQVGFVAIFEYFSGFGFILLSNIIHARPLAGNANCWAASTSVVDKAIVNTLNSRQSQRRQKWNL